LSFSLPHLGSYGFTEISLV